MNWLEKRTEQIEVELKQKDTELSEYHQETKKIRELILIEE